MAGSLNLGGEAQSKRKIPLSVFLKDASEEDRKWFMEAMQSQTIDIVKRMKETIQNDHRTRK